MKFEPEHKRAARIRQRDHELHREPGLRMDPATAKIYWKYGGPYAMQADPADEKYYPGRVRFARAPDSDLWINFDDLPEATVKALRKRMDEPHATTTEGVMAHEAEEKLTDKTSLEDRTAIRQEAGRRIDSTTAEISLNYGFAIDPYRDAIDLPEEAKVSECIYFARAPGSNLWVEFGDLPLSTISELWKRIRCGKG